LAPAYAIFSRYGAEGFLATFACSNIIPQPHALNAGIWEALEVAIAGRSGHGGGWAERVGPVIVINGPVYSTSSGYFKAGVAIPATCFSIIIGRHSSTQRALAFEIPNEGNPRGPLDRYLVSIQRIEQDTGLDAFAGDAEPLRAQLETTRGDRLW